MGYIPQIDGINFWVNDLALEPGTNQLVAAIRDQAGNMGYATNEVFLTTEDTEARSFGYNAAGCLTNRNGVSLEWDERYRLKSVDDASSFVSYEYDALGRKVSRTAGGSPATVERYIHEGDHIVADVDASGHLLRSYTHGPGIDNILTMTAYGSDEGVASTNTYHYLKDHQNTVIALADSAGNVVESYEYEAYGRMSVFDAADNELDRSAFGNRFLFQGREIDWTTGLYHFRARWYDSETGRWLSKDPIGIKGGLNQYEFCASNPVMFVDPMGLLGVWNY